jgi:CubicO group peptidase (beta-lactamase class C family)
MESILDEMRIAGASIAFCHRGELVISRGYGLADVQRDIAVEPDTLFSTASVSKPITGVGVLKLVAEGRLPLNARMVDVLQDLTPLPGQQIVDPRFREITIHQLLYHAAGLPRDFKVRAPDAANSDENAHERDIVESYRVLMSRPLEFAPGSTHKYSNIGFEILRLVIERVAGQAYEPYTQQEILKPMGIVRMRMEQDGDYGPNESHRYQQGGRKPAFRQVANWLAPAQALARFASAVAGSGGEPFLGPKVSETMLALPPGIQPNKQGAHVGLGWDTVAREPDGYRFSKNGGKAGVRAWLEHLPSGIDWAVMFNTDPPEGRDVLGETRRRMLEFFNRTFRA